MNTPPPLPHDVRTAPERTILIVSVATFVVVLFLLGAATLSHAGCLSCKWKALTGLPCAGCGGTRALLSLTHGDLSGALLLNPGAVLLAASIAIASLYAASVVFLGVSPLRPSWAARVPWRWLLVAAIAANWIYLLAAGRA